MAVRIDDGTRPASHGRFRNSCSGDVSVTNLRRYWVRHCWAAVLVALVTAGCATASYSVKVNDSCIQTYGPNCDWVTATEMASRRCTETLSKHWSSEVRRVCSGGAPDESIRFGNLDVHFDGQRADDSRRVSGHFGELEMFSGAVVEFSVPGNPSGEITLSHDRDVAAIVKTSLGTLIAVDSGEFGGGLVQVSDRGDPHVLLRRAVSHVFEQDGEVFAVSGGGVGPDRLFLISRSSQPRLARWEVGLRLVLPGQVSSVYRDSGDIVIVTGSGSVRMGTMRSIEFNHG